MVIHTGYENQIYMLSNGKSVYCSSTVKEFKYLGITDVVLNERK